MLIKRYKEFTEVEKFLEEIKKDCQPFLKLLKENEHVQSWGNKLKPILYRGIKNREGDFLKEKVRKERQSLDSGKHVDIKVMDDLFEEKFGIRPRSEGVFCSFDITQADRYGDIFMIFPIGDFDYIINDQWTDTMDAWLWYLDDAKDDLSDEEYKEFIEKWGELDSNKKIPSKYVKHVVDSHYYNDKFEHGIKHGTEMMVVCDEYYAIRYDKSIREKVINSIY